jgi:hypothetical protein
MTRIALVAGALLGVLSRIEETTAGLSLGISANSTWLAVAFLAGMAHRRAAALAGARAGALALTAANLAYYTWIAVLEPGVELAAVAGSPLRWLLLGASGGAVFAVAGRLWARGRGPARVLASLPLAGVCIADGIPALLGGALTDGVGLVLGVVLAVISGTCAADRLLGGALAAATVAIALTGRLELLMP